MIRALCTFLLLFGMSWPTAADDGKPLSAILLIARAETPPEQATRVLDGVYASTDLELLCALLGRDRPMDGLRIFIGHSGWAPGQFEAEIARGDWTLAPAEPDAIFGRRSEDPWPERPAPNAAHRT